MSQQISTPVLHDNSFFITNSHFPQSRLQACGASRDAVGTPHAPSLDASHLWTLRLSHTHTGYYYIESVNHDRMRLAKWGDRDDDPTVGLVDGYFFHDQLWRLERQHDAMPNRDSQQDGAQDHTYVIRNKECPTAVLAKWGPGPKQWGACTYDLGTAAHWRLTPRFRAIIHHRPLWTVDNTTCTRPLLKPLNYTLGVSVHDKSHFHPRRSFTEAVECALVSSCEHTRVAACDQRRLAMEVANVRCAKNLAEWTQQRNLDVEVPPGVVYSLTQLVASIVSPLHEDNCTLLANFVVHESATSQHASHHVI